MDKEARWAAGRWQWAHGWRGLLLPSLPLVYLIFVVGAIDQNSRGAASIAGYVILAAFAACWVLAAALLIRPGTIQPALYGVLVALFIAELPIARAAAFVCFVFLTIPLVGWLGRRSWPVVLAMSLVSLLVPVAIPAWHVSLGDSFADITPIAIPVVAVTVGAVAEVLRSNQALADARTELARLAAENERSRIARDLHDVLGHSLTTITVKASLAHRLGRTDPERALAEIAEVETLARQSLADVRSAVAGYRDVSLAGELATGREVLRAAGISADLPRAVDLVDPAHQELFGWVVREGLTNVVRHSRAGSCTVRLTQSSVEIIDDGVGEAAAPGNGLSGLRERVSASGGVVEVGPVKPAGWRLLVRLAAPLSVPKPGTS
jgi:two-component system, NarL family, sensor histidine kinase DesK